MGGAHCHLSKHWHAQGFPHDKWHGELGGSCSMGFEHVGDAGGSLAALATELIEICLGLFVEGSVAA